MGQQQRRLHQQDTANGKADHSIIHRTYLPSHSAKDIPKILQLGVRGHYDHIVVEVEDIIAGGDDDLPFCRTMPAIAGPRF